VVHGTALNSSDNLQSFPADNHHCSDAIQSTLNWRRWRRR